MAANGSELKSLNMKYNICYSKRYQTKTTQWCFWYFLVTRSQSTGAADK
jgi:hypothetical protein